MYILAECHGDTMLSRMVLVPAFSLQHADIDRSCNIGEVSNRLRKFYTNRKAIGIIDKAKNIGATFKSFQVYPKHDLTNMVHLWNKQTHHLIYFKNGLEHFINESADQAKFNRDTHSGFKTTKQIAETIKDIQIEKDGEFRNFLADIRKANPDNFKTLIGWVSEIKDL